MQEDTGRREGNRESERESSLLFSCFAILEQACFSTAWGNNPCKHRVGTMVDSHRGAGTRQGLCDCLVFREGVTTRKNGSHSVVLYHSLECPKADHFINRWVVGRAKCLRVARRPLSPAERKKRARERERNNERKNEGKRERERETENRQTSRKPW